MNHTWELHSMLVSYFADFNNLFKVSSQVCPIGCNIILDTSTKYEPNVL